jgi:GNAT superfamily N-acetyltransferase
MSRSPAVRTVAPSGSAFDEVCALFDAYRAHYGEPASLAATRRWLGEQLRSGRFRLAAALVDGRAAGFVTSVAVPASLTLRTAWLIRDLFVEPRHRRSGLGRLLLGDVLDAARADRVFRISLQTETGNAPALALYESLGFQRVRGMHQLTLILE